MPTVVVGTTMAAHAMAEPDYWSSWLLHAEEQRADAAAHGLGLRHFVALQLDARGLEPFAPLLARLEELGGEYWTYALDDGRTRVTMTNRWRHINFGQNLVNDYCQADRDAQHLLFLAADCAAPPDIVTKMLEMRHPLCAPYITTYGLRGTAVLSSRSTGMLYPKEWGVEDAMASAAAIWIDREVFRKLRWRWDLETGMSDDPCFHHDAQTLLGIPTYVRHDVLARHFPEAVGDYEYRFSDPAALDVRR